MRGRMPSTFVFVVGLLFVSLFTFPRTAHADPHAVFYTAIGQRQLFFNFLAALDQADYVEPALGNFSRSELEQKRDTALRTEAEAAGQTADLTQDPVSAATQTELSGLVVRPITLEGNDLFTQLTAKDRAVEAKRQAGLADLLTRNFCRALGRKNCSDEQGALVDRSQAFVTDPLKWSAAPFVNGVLATLLSGTDAHVTQLSKVKASKEFQPGFLYNKTIGALYKSLSPQTQEEFTQTTLRTALSMLPLVPNPDTFKDVTVDSAGNVRLAFEAPRNSATNTALAAETSAEYVAQYQEKANQYQYLDQALLATALQGATSIETIQDTIEAEGEIADVKLKAVAEPTKVCGPNPKGVEVCRFLPPEESDYYGLIPGVVVPAAGKLAQVDAAAQGLADANTGLHDASVLALENPVGTVPLTQGEDQSEVKGITTSAVAGTITDNRTKFDSVARAVNERFPHAGQELGHVVEALSPGRYTGTLCGCGIDATANAFGGQIIAAINKYSL